MQENETVNSISNIDDSWNVNFVKLNNNNNNAGISNVSSSKDFLIPNELFEIDIEIFNNSDNDEFERDLEIFIDDVNVGRLLIDIESRSKKIYKFF